MEVYPTAPFDTQAQHPSVGVPSGSAGANVESPGKTMGMLSKVKKKAKMFRNKVKKVTGSHHSASTDHGDNAPEHGNRDFKGMPGAHERDVDVDDDDEDEAGSNEDEEDEQDFHKSNEHKYEQLRSIGALDNHGDGSEVEVRGGIPVPAMGDNTGSSWKEADADDPISAYKSAGPPGALQATPTAYRNYAADEEELPGEGVSTDSGNRGFEASLEEGSRSNETVSALSGPELKRETDDSSRPYDVSEKPDPKQVVSNVSVSDSRDEPALDSLSSSSRPFEEAAAPDDQVGIMEEDFSADRKLGVGLSSDQHFGSDRASVLETPSAEHESEVNKSNNANAKSGESQSKYGVLGTGGISASGIDEPYPEDLGHPNPSFGQSSSPKSGESQSKYGVLGTRGISASGIDESYSEGLVQPNSSFGRSSFSKSGESYPEGLVQPNPSFGQSSFSKSGESQSKYGVLGTGGISASSIDESYPEDLVQPNPSFGQSSSPIHDKIGVINKDVLSDEKLGLGLSSGDNSGSSKGNLLETSVPEGEELSGYQKRDSLASPEVDELVYKPVSDLAGQSEKLSESSSPTSGLSMATMNTDNENVAHSDSREKVYDVPSEQFTHEEAETTGDDSHEGGEQWVANKIHSAKDPTVSSLVANEFGNDGEILNDSGNKSVGAIGITDNMPDSTKLLAGETLDNSGDKSVDAIGTSGKIPETAKLAAVEDENQEPEEEFYNPNEVKNDQFKKGFTLGNAEDDALSGTLAGSAIETLQGLRNTVQSSLGYSSQSNSDVGGEDRSDIIGSEEKAFSPRGSPRQQRGGFVHGLRQSFKSSLGYGRNDPEENVGEEADVSERGVELEGEVDSRHQQSEGAEHVEEKVFSPRTSQPSSPGSSQQWQKGGFVQGLRQSIASSLGYGKGNVDEQDGHNTDALERGEDSETDVDVSQQHPDEALVLSSDISDEQPKDGSVNYVKQLSDKDGYHDRNLDKEVAESDVDTKQQQPAGTYQSLKNVFASTLGYGVESGEETSASEEPKSSEYSVKSEKRDLFSNEGEIPESVTKPRIVVNDAKDSAGKIDESMVPSPRGRGMLQGLKDTFASTLGYNNHPEETHKGISEPESKVEPELKPEPEVKPEPASSASEEIKSSEYPVESEKRELSSNEGEIPVSVSKPGIVVNDVKDNAGRVDDSMVPSPRRGGMLQGLRDTLTSTLGYNNHPEETHKGISEPEPKVEPELVPEPEREPESSASEEAKSSEYPVESEKRDLSSNEGEMPVSVSKPGIVVNDAKDSAERVDDSMVPSPRRRGMLQGLRDTLTSTLGYSSHPEETHKGISEPEPKVESEPEPEPECEPVLKPELKLEPEPEPEPEPESVSSPGVAQSPSYTQKLMDTTAAARSYLSSKVGYGSSNEEREETKMSNEY